MLKCGICGKPMMINGPKNTTVMNANPKGTIAHGPCYKKKFGTDPLDDLLKEHEIRKM